MDHDGHGFGRGEYNDSHRIGQRFAQAGFVAVVIAFDDVEFDYWNLCTISLSCIFCNTDK